MGAAGRGSVAVVYLVVISHLVWPYQLVYRVPV